MNCWKTINLTKDVGQHRILFLSMITMVFVFILSYLFINLLFPNVHLKDGHFLMFVLLLISINPIHKLLHALPILLSGCRVSLKLKQFFWLPTFQIKACQSISRVNMIVSLLVPFVIITSIIIFGSIQYPAYMHYFCIAMALNIGLCVRDFIFLKHLLTAPKMSYIEEYEDGYEVLIQKESF